jgi:hypothetical protein
MSVDQELKSCVGLLYVNRSDSKGRRRVIVGTCFFVGVFDRHGNSLNFLVTAKHVWEDAQRFLPLILRLNRAQVPPGQMGVIDFKLPKDRWIFHRDKGVDLAVLNWSTPERNIDLWVHDVNSVIPERLARRGNWPPVEGDEVFFAAMVSQYHGRERLYPTFRFGRIALVTDETINGKYGLSDYRVIDAQVYPGNSGAPVWVAYPTPVRRTGNGLTQDKNVYLMGVLAAGWPAKEEVFYRGKKNGVAEYVNLGIALVTPAEKILEIVKSPEVQAMVENRETDIEPDPVPLSVLPNEERAKKVIRKRKEPPWR